MYEGGQEISEICPTAYGVYAELVDRGRYLALTRSGAAWAPMVFARFVPQSLMAIPGVPSSISQLVDHSRPQQGLLRGWIGGSDPSELFSSLPMALARQLREETEQSAEAGLSWSVLASLLEEEQFLQILHYIIDATNAVEHSLATEVDAALPLIKEHRYAPFIDAFRYNFREDSDRAHQVYGSIKVEDLRGINMYLMMRALWYTRDAGGTPIGATAYKQAGRNFTLPGLLEYLIPLEIAKASVSREVLAKC